MFDSTQAEIDRLTIIQRQLDAAKARKTELEAQVRADRKVAATALRTKQTLEARAAGEEASVRSLLSQQRALEEAAADDVAEDQAQYAKLTQERASVEKRIAIRIATAKAAAARTAAAEKAAKIAARKAAAAERARKAREQSRHGSAKTRHNATSERKEPAHRKKAARRTSMASASHGFSYPVSAPITSPFGMRFHPVLHYWKLHDGTDFGAGCGAAIRAPYAGRVAERYYNAGYGNRLMIDHGFRSGKYVTTGYNHASGYVVHVGQHVHKGQVIGYVGSTGYSTGCHLHLMVWLNGRVTNPMVWF
jgi:murein DD-endopeptidase MepM/ murein hydrolase activator NlpD